MANQTEQAAAPAVVAHTCRVCGTIAETKAGVVPKGWRHCGDPSKFPAACFTWLCAECRKGERG